MQLWFIPIFYAVTSVVGGIVVPRLEARFLPYSLDLSVSSAQAFLSAVASGMMALTGIVFSIAFVLVQFNAIVYSPRLVVWLARDRTLFHSLGVFVATFMYSLSTLAWVDRSGAGKVPLVSCLLVAAMLIASVILLSLLVQRLNSLQITQVLRIIGDTGREVIARTYRPRQAREGACLPAERQSPPVALTVRYMGKPAVVTSLDIRSLVDQACKSRTRIVVACAVGDTLIEGTRLLKVYGGKVGISESELRRSVRIGEERKFEQDPKYAIRLLVDIAIKALSPAINDPTTAVQAIDQIEDLLRRLANCDIETCEAIDADGVVRVIYQVPSWNDYLTLAFDEIRQFGSTSIQVIRRLRAALVELAQLVDGDRAELVGIYLQHLDSSIDRSTFDPQDRATARVEDRQGLGISRRSDVAVPRS